MYKNTTFSFFLQVFYYICLRDCEFFHSLTLVAIMAEKMARNIIIGILLLTLYCCQYRSELNSDKNLTKEIEQKITVKSSHIDLSDLNYFEWDSFLVLGPYSNVENIEDKTNLNLDKIRGNGIKFSDSFNLLIFIKSGKVAKISELSRN